MDLHQNARSCPASRAVLVRRIVEEGWRVRAAAVAIGISERSAYRWLARYRGEGEAGPQDRSRRGRDGCRDERLGSGSSRWWRYGGRGAAGQRSPS